MRRNNRLFQPSTYHYNNSRPKISKKYFEKKSKKKTHRGTRSGVQCRERRKLSNSKFTYIITIDNNLCSEAENLTKEELSQLVKDLEKLQIENLTEEELSHLIKDLTKLQILEKRELNPITKNRIPEKLSVLTNTEPFELPETDPNTLVLDKLRDVYRCSQCKGFAVPEFYECPNDHYVCEDCWLILPHCPQCVGNKTFRRVRSAERIAKLLKFSCIWSENGCTEVFSSSSWRYHINVCRYSQQKIDRIVNSDQSNFNSIIQETGSTSYDENYLLDSPEE